MGSFCSKLKDFLYGFALYGMVREVAGRKREEEDAFALLAVGDLLGVPAGPLYYRLRLLPYLVPRIDGKRRCSGPRTCSISLESEVRQ